MQNNTDYNDLIKDILDFLTGNAENACNKGVCRNKIIIDPESVLVKALNRIILLLMNWTGLPRPGFLCLSGFRENPL
jgi:dihydropteroate synthase